MSERETMAAHPTEKLRVDDLRVQLPLRREIDWALDTLIRAGAGKVALLYNNRDNKKKLALSRSQLRNVVNVAVNTESPEVVTNFIRYQMGRKEGDGWRFREGDRMAFGREVIADLEGRPGESGVVAPGVIDEAVRAVCDRVESALAPNRSVDRTELERCTRSRLIELYLGYLNRTYAYCEAMDQQDPGCWQDVQRVAGKRK